MAIDQLHTENADLDLTSQVAVLTDTPDAVNAVLAIGLVQLGDGVKDLDGSGGNFELTITVGGQTVERDPQVITFSTATRSAIWTSVLPIPANDEVVIKIKSPNVADNDVDVTSYLFRAARDSITEYTRGDEAALPGNDNNLEMAFAAGDYDDVSVDDGSRVAQTATGEFAIFLFKNQSVDQDPIFVNWNGQSDLACSDSTIYLQIYNRDLTTWETLDSDSITAANTDFNLFGQKTVSLSDYYDNSNWVACRVYQEAA